MEMELTMPLPCTQRRPASITSHLELSTMMGTRAMSGSDAMSCRKRTMAALLSSMASSMSMSWAPFYTCWRATARASSYWPFKIMRANALEPVTLVRSPMLTNKVPSPMETGSRPDSFMGGRDTADIVLTHLCRGSRKTGERRCGVRWGARGPSLTNRHAPSRAWQVAATLLGPRGDCKLPARDQRAGRRPRSAASSIKPAISHKAHSDNDGIALAATAVMVSVSVALLLPGLGSVTPPGAATVAVLTSVPVADALTVAVTV